MERPFLRVLEGVNLSPVSSKTLPTKKAEGPRGVMGAALDHGLQLHLLLHPIKLFLRYDGLMEAIIDI